MQLLHETEEKFSDYTELSVVKLLCSLSVRQMTRSDISKNQFENWNYKALCEVLQTHYMEEQPSAENLLLALQEYSYKMPTSQADNKLDVGSCKHLIEDVFVEGTVKELSAEEVKDATKWIVSFKKRKQLEQLKSSIEGLSLTELSKQCSKIHMLNDVELATPQPINDFKLSNTFIDIFSAKSRKPGAHLSFKFVKKAMPFGARPGDVGVYAAKPNGGKSLVLAQETVALLVQGYKVVLIEVVGDMPLYKILCRILSQLSGKTINAIEKEAESEENLQQMSNYYAPLLEFMLPQEHERNQLTLNNMEFELTRYARHLDADAVVMDYDAGIYAGHEDSYTAGGEVYGEFSRVLNKIDCFGLIGCQPIKDFYKEERLTLEALGSSRQKGEVAAWMVGLGHNPLVKAYGEVFLAKNRHGESEVYSKCFWNDKYSKCKEIGDTLYSKKIEELAGKSANEVVEEKLESVELEISRYSKF